MLIPSTFLFHLKVGGLVQKKWRESFIHINKVPDRDFYKRRVKLKDMMI